MTQKLMWGLLGTGNIAKAFAEGLATAKSGSLVAIGSRGRESAESFGAKHNIPRRHASYQALLDDDQVQAVYIATPHPMHASDYAVFRASTRDDTADTAAVRASVM